MTRIIKFRAWDGENIFNPIFVLNQENTEIKPETLKDLRFQAEMAMNIAIENMQKEGLVLMQFTGLHDDKQGKEIYEGDILTYDHVETDTTDWLSKGLCYNDLPKKKFIDEIGDVFWDVDGFWVRWQTSDVNCTLCGIENVKIIGNIYENPELLTQNKNAKV